jgi:hypothetical protein
VSERDRAALTMRRPWPTEGSFIDLVVCLTTGPKTSSKASCPLSAI